MAENNYTTFRIECQGFVCEKEYVTENGKRVFIFQSQRKVEEEKCPYCGQSVVGNGIRKIRLTDVPLQSGTPTIYEVHQHRYRCRHCGKTYTEQNPFKVQGYNLTQRCMEWIFRLLKYKIQTSAIAEILGISWNTVRTFLRKTG